MSQRLVTGLIFAASIIAAVFFMPHFFFLVILFIIVGVAFWEWTQFMSWSRGVSMALYIAISTIVIGLSSLYRLNFYNLLSDNPLDSDKFIVMPHFLLAVLIVAVLWWLFSLLLVSTHPRYESWWRNNNLLKFLFGCFTLIPFLISVLMLRYMPAEICSNGNSGVFNHYNTYHGILILLVGCLMVWIADSGAYYGGRRFGKHKLAVKVSPNKTIEGVVSGVVASFIALLLFSKLVGLTELTMVNMLLITLIVVPVSVLGDLNESMLKRVANIKDSGSFLPGHGGILDRIDGLSAALPIYTLLYFTFVH